MHADFKNTFFFMFDITKPVKNGKRLGKFDVFVKIKIVMIEYPPTCQNSLLQMSNLSENNGKIFFKKLRF